MTNQQSLHSDKSSKSLHKDYDTFSHKSQNKMPYVQRFDSQGGIAQPIKLAQKTSGFYQKAP